MVAMLVELGGGDGQGRAGRRRPAGTSWAAATGRDELGGARARSGPDLGPEGRDCSVLGMARGTAPASQGVDLGHRELPSGAVSSGRRQDGSAWPGQSQLLHVVVTPVQRRQE
jgi:hypothetical protein